MAYPIILFDKNNQIIKKHIKNDGITYFLRGNQKFNIKVLSSMNDDNVIIYNATLNPSPVNPPNDLFIITSDSNQLTDKYDYTIFVKQLPEIINIEITNNFGEKNNYILTFIDSNKITIETEFYEDLLINKNQPNYSILEPALVTEDKAFLIRRLLLEYNNIQSQKGKDSSIEQFLYMIGFNPLSIQVEQEWKKPNNEITMFPDKLTDVKTGNYHVLYNNWEVDINNQYLPNNLPNRINTISDVEDFLQELYYAISIANVYFTIEEQKIIYFGMTNSSNSPRYLSITSTPNKIYRNNLYYYSKHLHINLYNLDNSTGLIKNFLVKNNSQIKTNISKSIVKYIKTNGQTSLELFLIDEQYFDNTETEDLININQSFAILLNLQIDLSYYYQYAIDNNLKFYYDYTIQHSTNQLISIKSNKLLFDDDFIQTIKFVTTRYGGYDIIINIYDDHNNKDTWFYKYILEVNNAELSFKCYNSTTIVETNDITLEIDSNQLTQTIPLNNKYILSADLVPEDLVNYYNLTPNINFQYFLDHKPYNLPEINPYYSVNSVTETLPLKYADSFLHVYSMKVLDNYVLMLRYLDENFQTKYISPIIDSNTYVSQKELIGIVRILPIYQSENDIDFSTNPATEINPPTNYYFISTNVNSILLNNSTFDLVLFELTDTEFTNPISIYDLPKDELIYDISDKKLSVNYPFTMFKDFSDNNDVTQEPINIDSTFTHLININDENPNTDTYHVTLGDIVVCMPDNNFTINENDITWKVYNSLNTNDEPIYISNDFSLKFRINEIMVYDVELTCFINNQQFNIYRKSLFSSLQ